MAKVFPYVFSIIVCIPFFSPARSQDRVLESGVDNLTSQRPKITMYPNPVESGSYLFLQPDSSCPRCTIEQLYIYDETGLLLRRINFRTEPNILIHRVNITGLNPGRYIIRIVSDGLAEHFLSRQLKIE